MATPPSKRYCSDLSECEPELECTNDMLIFPSDEECDVPAESDRDFSFYPSEDSNQQGSSNDVCTEDSLYFYLSEESNQQNETTAAQCNTIGNTSQEELADTQADTDSDSLDATIVEESNKLENFWLECAARSYVYVI